MKILFTSFAYYPETSGVPIVVQNLAEALSRRGHQVSVVTSSRGKGYPPNETINGVEVVRFNFGVDIFKRPRGNYAGYIEFVKNFDKDVLVLECIQCFTTDILLPHLKDMKCKVVIHSHGGPGVSFPFLGWEGNLFHSIGHIYNWFYFKYYYGSFLPSNARYIDKVICLSLCASDLEYMNRTMKNVSIVENAVHDMFLDESLYNKDISNTIKIKNRNYILCVSNYSSNKCQVDIVKAFEKTDIKDCSLVMIGSSKNDYYYKLQRIVDKIVRRSGKEIIILTGIERSLFPSIIHQAKLFVMASKHEEYPVSLVEAMTVGCPFVSTDAGCARILPGGVTVINRNELSLFINMVANNDILLRKLGKQGKDYAYLNNTLNNVCKLFESELES